MKKSVLSLSIATVLAGFGGTAMADSATTLAINPAGAGHILLVPYFTTQGGNSTLINLTNTDTVNGKAVKVRFRSASNSDDIFDFQVFLSPGDVYPMSLGASATGGTTITTSTTADPDITCTKPTATDVDGGVNGKTFGTSRVDGKIAATREGYVEILNMGDITPNSDLYIPVLHSTVPANRCTGAAWTNLDTQTSTTQKDLALPTTGLMANWTILNVAGTGAAWGGAATAVQANDDFGAAGTGNIVYYPQSKAKFASSTALTADPFLNQVLGANALLQDFPDLSTPYAGAIDAPAQAADLTAALATSSIINEFLTGAGVGATTDFVFSMPTRRYSVAYNYANDSILYTALSPSYFDATNVEIDTTAKQICVKNISYLGWNREENYTKSPTDIVVSPAETDPTTPFCGETSVLAINRGVSATLPTGSLQAQLAIRGLDVKSVADTAGWVELSTPGSQTAGLPILGASFVSATTGTSFIGASWPHRTVLTNKDLK